MPHFVALASLVHDLTEGVLDLSRTAVRTEHHQGAALDADLQLA